MEVRLATWALKHPWRWTGVCAGFVYIACVAVFRVTLSRDLGVDLVMAAWASGLFWLALGSVLSFATGRRKT